MKTIVIYLRVSSNKQDTASQEPDLKRWVAGNIDVLRGDVEVVWVRDKFTGKTMDRPGFSKIASMIAMRSIDTLVIWRLDRLGRTAKGLTALFEDLQGAKVNLISLRDGLDLSTPAGRLMANVLASVAAYETEVRSERVVAGLEVAVAAGVKLGRPEGCHTRLKVTGEQEVLVRRLKVEGQKVAAIARATGLSRPTIYSILA